VIFRILFEKTKPILGMVNWLNNSNSNDLWRFLTDGGVEKTKPNKANLPAVGRKAEARSSKS